MCLSDILLAGELLAWKRTKEVWQGMQLCTDKMLRNLRLGGKPAITVKSSLTTLYLLHSGAFLDHSLNHLVGWVFVPKVQLTDPHVANLSC